jgi:hypothetical protein
VWPLYRIAMVKCHGPISSVFSVDTLSIVKEKRISLSEPLVMDLHWNAPPELKKRMEEEAPKHFEDTVYSCGDVFKICDSTYILARVANNAVNMINLQNGNRLGKEFMVNDTQFILKSDLVKWPDFVEHQTIKNDKFKRIKK